MKKTLQIPARQIPSFRKYNILLENGDRVYLSGDYFSLPGLMGFVKVEKLKVIDCKVGKKLKYSYCIKGVKKAIIESASNVKEINSESK